MKYCKLMVPDLTEFKNKNCKHGSFDCVIETVIIRNDKDDNREDAYNLTELKETLCFVKQFNSRCMV